MCLYTCLYANLQVLSGEYFGLGHARHKHGAVIEVSVANVEHLTAWPFCRVEIPNTFPIG